MSYAYNTHSDTDRQEMLHEIGVETIGGLFQDIPESLKLKKDLNLPPPLSEWELKKRLSQLAQKNTTTQNSICLLGGGAYEHYIPAVVNSICSRGEFLTSYTPYQPEMSQGLLQVLFEYQKMMSKLSGMEAVNCSMYDGATAFAEAAWMACQIKKNKKILVSDTISDQFKMVLKTYMKGRDVIVDWINADASLGSTDLSQLKKNSSYAAVMFQSPNKFGVLEDMKKCELYSSSHDSLFVLAYNPMLFGLLKKPSFYNVDILTCEGQPFGLPLAGGGPYLGVLATHTKYIQFLPGRLVGQLMDLNGKKAYALVKEEREQHVAREKATSHICSNQALQAIKATIYLATIGAQGLKEIAIQNVINANYLKDLFLKNSKIKLKYSSSFFNEFVIDCGDRGDKVYQRLLENKVYCLKISSSDLQFAVTEMRSFTELDFVANLVASEFKNV